MGQFKITTLAYLALCLPSLGGSKGSTQAQGLDTVYGDPFDLGAGGSVLTWATQESVLMNNPALLPHGKKAFRWLGYKINLAPGLDSINVARSYASSNGQSEESSAGTDQEIQETLERFETPVHLGTSGAVSLIVNNGGFAGFFNVAPDIRYWPQGDVSHGSGIPNVVLRSETYAGGYVAGSTLLNQYFSFGASCKYLLINRQIRSIELTDPQAISELGSIYSEFSGTNLSPSTLGMDLSSLIFLQGEHVDYRLAITTTNLGGLKLASQESIPQMVHAGVGLTFHSQQDALHLSIDYRDVLNASPSEPSYKRFHLGSRFLLRGLLGVSSGIYHGAPSYGLEIDLILMRLAVAYYTREYYANPGIDSRPIVVLSYSQGLAI